MTELLMPKIDMASMVAGIHRGKKDPILVDFCRQIGPRWAKMVEFVGTKKGEPVSAHNNKTLFLEGIDLWCRATMNQSLKEKYGSAGGTSDPKKIVVHVMTPWYKAMELDNPRLYRMGNWPPPPVYTGTPEDATVMVMSLAACLEIYPMAIRVGKESSDGAPAHVWAKIKADGKWYESDVSNPRLRLGEVEEYPAYDEVEVDL